jgi:hypothetical protein
MNVSSSSGYFEFRSVLMMVCACCSICRSECWLTKENFTVCIHFIDTLLYVGIMLYGIPLVHTQKYHIFSQCEMRSLISILIHRKEFLLTYTQIKRHAYKSNLLQWLVRNWYLSPVVYFRVCIYIGSMWGCGSSQIFCFLYKKNYIWISCVSINPFVMRHHHHPCTDFWKINTRDIQGYFQVM